MIEQKFKTIVRGLLSISFLFLLAYILTTLEIFPRLDGGFPVEITKFDDNQTWFNFDGFSLYQLYAIFGLVVVLIALIYGLSWFMRREGVYLLIITFLPLSLVCGLGYVNFETNYTLLLSDLCDVTFTIASVMIFLKHYIVK